MWAPRASGLRGEASRKPYGVEPLVGQVHRVRGELLGLAVQRVDARLGDHAGAFPHGVQAEDRRGADTEPVDRVVRDVPAVHGELVALAEPAPDRLAQARVQVPPHVQEGGRARSGVEVLVGAADGEIGTGRGQRYRYRAGRVAQVPQHQRAGVMHETGHRGQVGEGAGAVRHVRERHQRDVGVDRLPQRVVIQPGVDVGRYHPQLVAARLGQPLQHVLVGRKVVVVGDDDAPAGSGVTGRRGQLVQVDAGRVAHHDLARLDPEYAGGQLVTGVPGERDPVRPAVDQLLAPLLVDRRPQPVDGGPGQPAERVAVEVHEVGVGDHEPVPERGERIGRVPGFGVGARHRVGHSAIVPPPGPGRNCPAP